MRIGYATWNLAARTLTESIEKAVECGCRAVSFDLTPLEHQRPGENQTILDLVARHGLDVTCHGTLGQRGDRDPMDRLQDEVDAIIEWHCASGRVKGVTYDPATTTPPLGGTPQFDFDKTVERLAYACDRLGRRGINVAVENWLVNSHLDSFQAVKDAVGADNLGALLDVGHLNIAVKTGLTGGLSAGEYVRRMPLPIHELHLHYNNGTDDQHRPLEAHSTVLQQVVEALVERGFDGIATLEHGGELTPETLQSIAKSRTIFEKLFAGYQKGRQQ